MRKKVLFELSAYEDFKNWEIIEGNIYRKIIDLLKNIEKFSLKIIDESVPLKRELNGYWSIKINEEHRLVYKVTNTAIIIISCKYYYN